MPSQTRKYPDLDLRPRSGLWSSIRRHRLRRDLARARAARKRVDPSRRVLFVSARASQIERSDSARRFVEGLEAAGFRLTWSPIDTLTYRKVSPLVLATDAVVALVTGGWGVSTYHAVEVFSAVHGNMDGVGRILDTPLPVFAYVEDPIGEGWFHDRIRRGMVVVLPDDPEEAVAAVRAGLS